MLAAGPGSAVVLINHNQTHAITSIFLVNYREGQVLHSAMTLQHVAFWENIWCSNQDAGWQEWGKKTVLPIWGRSNEIYIIIGKPPMITCSFFYIVWLLHLILLYIKRFPGSISMKILFSLKQMGFVVSSQQASNIFWHLVTCLNAICVLISGLHKLLLQKVNMFFISWDLCSVFFPLLAQWVKVFSSHSICEYLPFAVTIYFFL